MYNEKNKNEITAIQHLADELAIQNMIEALRNLKLPLDDQVLLVQAIKAHVLTNAKMALDKINNGVTSVDNEYYRQSKQL